MHIYVYIYKFPLFLGKFDFHLIYLFVYFFPLNHQVQYFPLGLDCNLFINKPLRNPAKLLYSIHIATKSYINTEELLALLQCDRDTYLQLRSSNYAVVPFCFFSSPLPAFVLCSNARVQRWRDIDVKSADETSGPSTSSQKLLLLKRLSRNQSQPRSID